MLSPKRDLTAAKLFLRLALSGGAPSPRVINVDGHPAYPSAIAELKQSAELGRRCRCRTSPYLNHVIEQDHRFIKKRITASLGFRSTEGAWRTIEGYEAMHAIRNRRCRVVLSRDYTLATLVSSAFRYLQQNRSDYADAFAGISGTFLSNRIPSSGGNIASSNAQASVFPSKSLWWTLRSIDAG